ncbi:hypothetical protein [Glaciihabitans sp. UYNi722]|uniref:hypothetical protein n=1 Tax=Glaciihabitans sp. UYNi722 TaxID=3156344 RepID=UPI003395C33D
MTLTHRIPTGRRATAKPSRPLGRVRRGLAVGAAVAALALAATCAIAPAAPPSAAEQLNAYIAHHGQTLTVSDRGMLSVTRDAYSTTAGVQTLSANGTNYDWAKVVLMSGGWPTTDDNVTVLVRWMRQENGPDNWWNRNNPMNNGYGSGGGGGTGSYANLVIAAQKAAENLQRNPSFSAIVTALATAAPTSITEQAIWASPWASSHYGNGSRWHYTPVPVVTAPSSAW